MIIFCFLGVGPPCCSILCRFWLCEEAQCVYLRRHLGSPAACLSNLQNIGLLSFDFLYCLYWGSPEGGKYILYVYIIYIVIYFICIICIIYYIYKELAYTVVEAE